MKPPLRRESIKDEMSSGGLSAVDLIISVITGTGTLLTGLLDATPWPVRIFSAILAAAGALWLWRHLGNYIRDKEIWDNRIKRKGRHRNNG